MNGLGTKFERHAYAFQSKDNSRFTLWPHTDPDARVVKTAPLLEEITSELYDKSMVQTPDRCPSPQRIRPCVDPEILMSWLETLTVSRMSSRSSMSPFNVIERSAVHGSAQLVTDVDTSAAPWYSVIDGQSSVYVRFHSIRPPPKHGTSRRIVSAEGARSVAPSSCDNPRRGRSPSDDDRPRPSDPRDPMKLMLGTTTSTNSSASSTVRPFSGVSVPSPHPAITMAASAIRQRSDRVDIIAAHGIRRARQGRGRLA